MLLYIDSFGDVQDGTGQFNARNIVSPETFTITDGRYGGKGITASGNNIYKMVLPTMFGSGTTMILGFAIKVPNLNNTNNTIMAFSEYQTSSLGYGYLNVTSAGVLQFVSSIKPDNQNPRSILVQTPPATIRLQTFHFIELKVLWLRGNAGHTELRVDSVSYGTFDGHTIDSTQPSTSIGVSCINIPFNSQVLDDLYLCDDIGTTNNDFIGDCKVVGLKVNSTTNNQSWSLQSASNITLAVSGYAKNDLSYIYSNTVGASALCGLTQLASAITQVLGVQLNIATKKTDGSTRIITPIVSSGSSTFFDSNNYNLYGPSGYKYIMYCYSKNPITSNSWSPSQVNNMKIGVQLVA